MKIQLINTIDDAEKRYLFIIEDHAYFLTNNQLWHIVKDWLSDRDLYTGMKELVGWEE